MKALLSNAAYGILDYAAFPLGMIAVAPILIRNLGVARYGVWTVAGIAQSAAPVLSSIVWSSALLGFNVTATYALLSMGCVRIVIAANLLGGTLRLLLMFQLIPRLGIQGIAIARLSYSIVPLALYIPLFRRLFGAHSKRTTPGLLEPVGDER